MTDARLDPQSPPIQQALSVLQQAAGHRPSVHITLDTTLPFDGFRLQRNGSEWQVAGASARAAAYGLYWLADRVRSHRVQSLPAVVERAPSFRLRVATSQAPMFRHETSPVQFDDWAWLMQLDSPKPPYVHRSLLEDAIERFEQYCQILVQHGYNAVTVGNLIHCQTLETLSIHPTDDPVYQRALVYREAFKRMYKYARRLGLEWFFYEDEFAYTEAARQWFGEVCLHNPRLWDYYQERYRELLREFPDIAGVFIRHGEVNLGKDYGGHDLTTDYDGRSFKEQFCDCPKCAAMSFADRAELFLRAVHEVVHGEFGKTVVFRTWWTGIGPGNLHNDPQAYHKLFDRLPVDGIISCMKLGTTDFWFYQGNNPNIGEGHHQQMVVYQASGDYHGRGLFPCFYSKLWPESFRYCADQGAEHTWLWVASSGTPDGLGSQPISLPFFTGPARWDEANVYLHSRLCWDPHADPAEVALDWAVQNYGKEAAQVVAQIMMASEEATRQAIYIDAYARRHPWVCILPVRQHQIFCDNPHWHSETNKYPQAKPWWLLPYLTAHALGEIDQEISNAEAALARAQKDLAQFESVSSSVPDRRLADDTLYTLRHRLSLFNLLLCYKRAFLRYYAAIFGESSFENAVARLQAAASYDDFIAGSDVPPTTEADVQALRKAYLEYIRDFNLFSLGQGWPRRPPYHDYDLMISFIDRVRDHIATAPQDSQSA